VHRFAQHHSPKHEPRIIAPTRVRTKLIRVFNEIPISGRLEATKLINACLNAFLASHERKTESLSNDVCFAHFEKPQFRLHPANCTPSKRKYPCEILHVDLIGAFDLTPRGKKYRLHVWQSTVSLTGQNLFQIPNESFPDTHIPRKLVALVAQFVSQIFKRLSDRLESCTVLYTTAPQKNARCERENSWFERCTSVVVRVQESGCCASHV
jgi:hypothetical protein